jgi:hypothetical protein
MVAAVGVVSSNCTSDGSPPRAAAVAWYQPGEAQPVRGEHSSSERLACFQTIPTLVVTSLRTTMSRRGTARRHSRLLQIASSPDVIPRVTVSGEIRQVHAGELIVRSCSTIITSRPPTAFSTFGVTAMSEPAHVPSGWASTGAWLVSSCEGRVPLPGLPFLVAPADGVAAAVRSSVGAEEDESALSRAASPSPDEDALLPSPSSRAIAKTSSRAVPRTMIRRVQ